jgi:hypothetical protein
MTDAQAMILALSFEDLYRSEYPGLIAVATALSGADGEDLVQDAMVKAIPSVPALVSRSSHRSARISLRRSPHRTPSRTPTAQRWVADKVVGMGRAELPASLPNLTERNIGEIRLVPDRVESYR